MTQQELIDLILELRCCSARIAYNYATKTINGEKGCSIKDLLILNDSIDVLLKYEIDGNNCVDEDTFEQILDNAKQICEICNCE